MPDFFDAPILNSPYEYPARHWELGPDGQPTNALIEHRRKSAYYTPVPKPKKKKAKPQQVEMLLPDTEGISTQGDEYDPTPIVNELRQFVDQWRTLPQNQWGVTPETARLLQHWRHHPFAGIRPFFCQVEAVETAIWLAEVAPKQGQRGKKFLDWLTASNEQANPELFRIAFKLATGAGKTTVMAMLIAWQVINAVRYPTSKHFTKGFLLVTPGITIKDRLRVLFPNDPDSYYKKNELVPDEYLPSLEKAKIVITNYHAFKLRERLSISATGRALLKGRGPDLQTLETEGQMLQRVMPELMGMKNVLVLNDEAHHCYREKPADPESEKLTGDERKEAEENNEAARLWISGIEIVKRQLGVRTVYDLSATPFFLSGSGYREGSLFPWVMSDFSLMDAIECGIVKLPRVPIADNSIASADEMPKLRNLWEHIGKKMPKKGAGKNATPPDPLSLPAELQTALEALYGHYKLTFDLWQQRGIEVPPVFIVVCNNTSTSKLVFDFISGFHRSEDGKPSEVFHAGRLPLFRNYDEHGVGLARPKTLLIDSHQLESGEALDKNFHEVAADEIELFRREMIERSGNPEAAKNLTDQDILREVMNTVGKKGKLGGDVRCVVSVSMLTEGWDANTVTHILGVRAFGTQLLCEQVVGRGLRRQSYELNSDNRFDVEYADVLGIPFDFTAKPVVAPPKPPKKTERVAAVRPDRDALEITFPRVAGYRTELPNRRLIAKFTDDSILNLTPKLVGPSITQNSGIIGESVNLTVEHLATTRHSTILYNLVNHLLYEKYRDAGEEPPLHLFGQLKSIADEWLKTCLKCTGSTYPAQVLYREIAGYACERIAAAITEGTNERAGGEGITKVMLDPYNPRGSSRHVAFNTSKDLWTTKPDRCHINYVVTDSEWEAECCRVLEDHPRVIAYVKNQGLGFEVPYRMGTENRRYLPDFIALIDDGHGPDDPLHLIIEIKGFRDEDAKDKANTMRAYWIPGVNRLESFGRWDFVEFKQVFEIESDLKKKVASEFKKIIRRIINPPVDACYSTTANMPKTEHTRMPRPAVKRANKQSE